MKLGIWIILLGLLFTSCSDFLEEASQDEIRPSTVDDMDELLVGEGYNEILANEIDNITWHMTDDAVCYGYYKYVPQALFWLEHYQWKFTWNRNMFDEQGGGNDMNFWETPYSKIKGCNVVLDYLDEVDGNEKKRENLRGEAYTLRAFYYLMLVNFYGMPYNIGDPEKNLGVPLKLDMGVTEKLFKRNSVAEVYRSIEKDLLTGNKLMEESAISQKYDRLSHVAAKALLSRMYLYMEDWDKVIDYSTRVLTLKPELLSLASLNNLDEARSEGVYGDATPTEIIWARPEELAKSSRYEFGKFPYGVSRELVNLYEQPIIEDDVWAEVMDWKDLRLNLYFTTSVDDWNSEVFADDIQKGVYGNAYLQSGIRNAEMYLNRAEAYIHKFMETGLDEYRINALEDINNLREHRYDTRNTVYKKVDFRDAEELLEFYKDERRRELCGEGNHRWFDLKRWGMPELTHIYIVNPGEEQVYVLREKSSDYLLPIPAKAIEYNPMLEQNR